MEKEAFLKHCMCPQNRTCYPQNVKHVFGTVECPENLLGKSGTTVLKYDGDTAPRVILDLGEASVGGYPVFRVVSHKGTPTLRLAYSDWYDYIMEPTGEIGDFRRGCCKYLGVELPVLPGDPNRFDLFTVCRNGLFLYPLIQGQERWLMLQLDTPGTEVELEELYIHYTSDMTPQDGFFSCSNPDLTKLWYASVWTCQIASINNAQSWEILCGTLLLRALTKGNEAGIYNGGLAWTDYRYSFDGQIARNPHCASGIGWMVRADSMDNGYVLQLNSDGTVKAYRRTARQNLLLKEASVSFPVQDNHPYHIETVVSGNRIEAFIDDASVLAFEDDAFPAGTVGFCQTTEKWAMVNSLRVEKDGRVLFADDFSGTLDDYTFTKALSYVSDGAKRDRLPWIGDLDWAGRNIYYAFRRFDYMPNSLRMFAFHQTPEGYVWGTCYPENENKPAIGDYGYYESDIFSAWIVPTLADYLLFTGDKAFAEEIWPQILADADYLWEHVEGDGLFMQRYATSKGLWDHVLNDIGKFTYNNLIVSEAFSEAAYIAQKLGKPEEAAELSRRKEIVRRAIRERLWDHENGYLIKGVGLPGFCEMANSLALSIGFFDSREEAKAALDALCARTPGHGKITALMIRGAYMYDYNDIALETLLQPGYQYVEEGKTGEVFNALDDPNFDFASHHIHPANWIKSLHDWRGPATTWECMTYPPAQVSNGGAWGDRSHPDTAVAHILTGYSLGVLPTEPGFTHFEIKPHCYGLTDASGIIPSSQGDICFHWEKKAGVLTAELTYPEGAVLDRICIRKGEADEVKILINGKPAVKTGEDALYLFFT